MLQVIEARLSDGDALPVSHSAADVWAAGAVLFALLAGTPPYSRPSDAALPPQAKAVATLLRINTASRNSPHGLVSMCEMRFNSPPTIRVNLGLPEVALPLQAKPAAALLRIKSAAATPCTARWVEGSGALRV